jgi:hypothetical protein
MNKLPAGQECKMGICPFFFVEQIVSIVLAWQRIVLLLNLENGLAVAGIDRKNRSWDGL